ncbi:hypothetical protein 1992IndM4_0485 [Vibrio phage ICP1]|nr:hypothetical protein 1992IndM4_0485 [Vibrio phage ICP1]
MEITIGELFCGAGIGAIGSHNLGLKTVYAYDNMKYAVDTYNHNFGNIAEVVDLKFKPIFEIPYSDIIMTGFPCQPFSFNGKNLGVNDPDKGNLGKITYEIILEKEPKAFLLENVKGLASKKNLPFLLKLVGELSKYYNVTWDVKNCADYGVPQNRERVFIVGIRKDINKSFVFPPLTYENNPVSVKDTIEDIKLKGDYIPNHSVDCGIRNDETPYVKYLSDGQCWKDLPCEEMKKAFMKNAYYSGGGKTSYLGVIDKNKPARTILSSPKGKNSAQILKWEDQDHRRYTVRETLRLQSVPDWFVFPDHIPLMKQYERCSGIPPIVSELFLSQIVDIIKSS